MAAMISPDALRFAGPLDAAAQSGGATAANAALPLDPGGPGLPLLSSRVGNLFTDSVDPAARWYLATMALAADVDESFAFVASQASQEAGGQPFDTLALTLRLVATEPADAVQFATADASATLRPIPLAGLGAVLTSPYIDQTGAPQQRSFTASAAQPQADGSTLLTFSGVVGDAVPALYQDLRLFGKATLTLTATFQAMARRWFVRPVPHPPFVPPHPPYAPPGTIHRGPLPQLMQDAAAMSPAREATEAALRAAEVAAPAPGGSWIDAAAPQPWNQPLAIGLKYAADGYQLRYTVAGPQGPPAVVADVDQLRSLGDSPPSFVELKALGDINKAYPSLLRAFVGVFSQEIILIAARYGIVRGKPGLSATCLARLDSSAADPAACVFEFSFTVAPQVSRVELQQLQVELSRHPDLKDHQLTFPTALATTPASSLITTFGSTAQFAPGAEPHTFAVTLAVRDAGLQEPAVADASLLIQRLCSHLGADLVGELSLAIDGAPPGPIASALDLNFFCTVGTDELTLAVDPSGATLQLANLAAFDLLVDRYAMAVGGTVNVVAQPVTVAAGATVTQPLPPGATGVATGIAADSQLALPTPMPPGEALRLLNFVSVNVADTHVFVAVDASEVDFRLTSALTATVVFTSSPAVAPMRVSLTGAAPVSSATLVLPLQDAVFSLPASVQVTAIQTSGATVSFSKTADFAANPVFKLSQQDIDATPAS